VCIPKNRWKGFGFVFFRRKADLEIFISLGTISVKGSILTIKRHSEGKDLTKFKETFDNRRVFVRVLSKRKVSVDLYSLFSGFGDIEDAYFISKSELIEKNNYTIIGYVLFEQVQHAQQVIRQGCLELDGFKLLMKPIENKSFLKINYKSSNKGRSSQKRSTK
jgi:hypothetical protein